MFKDKTFFAVIPARGGSKRLPRKNVLDLAGKPLIAWSIDAAKGSKYIDQVVVTSDDAEILKIANSLSVDTIKRPAELASDTASTFDAIDHAIKQGSCKYDFIILLQATSPLRTAEHIDEAIELLAQKNADAVISVCETDHSPLWSNTLSEGGSLEGFISEDVKNKRSQDLPKYYRLNGAIYICNTTRLLKEKSFFLSNNINAYEMTRSTSIDIDSDMDLLLAKAYI